MFTYPAKSIFDASGKERVVWSEQEYDEALTQGWSEEKPEPSLGNPAVKSAKAKA